jgi:CheY-like chemotaxis protein
MRCALSKHNSAVTILVVDDDARLRKALRRVLVSHGFEVELAGNGDEARPRNHPRFAWDRAERQSPTEPAGRCSPKMGPQIHFA